MSNGVKSSEIYRQENTARRSSIQHTHTKWPRWKRATSCNLLSSSVNKWMNKTEAFQVSRPFPVITGCLRWIGSRLGDTEKKPIKSMGGVITKQTNQL
jgi:hypothetical protein